MAKLIFGVLNDHGLLQLLHICNNVWLVCELNDVKYYDMII